MDEAQDRSMQDEARTTRQWSTSTASHPDRIGPYRIVTLMGEGRDGRRLRGRTGAAAMVCRAQDDPAWCRDAGHAAAFRTQYEFLGRLQLPRIEALRALPSTPPRQVRAAAERLVAFYVASRRKDDAAAWRSRLQGMPAK
jgi:hypothetical protein